MRVRETATYLPRAAPGAGIALYVRFHGGVVQRPSFGLRRRSGSTRCTPATRARRHELYVHRSLNVRGVVLAPLLHEGHETHVHRRRVADGAVGRLVHLKQLLCASVRPHRHHHPARALELGHQRLRHPLGCGTYVDGVEAAVRYAAPPVPELERDAGCVGQLLALQVGLAKRHQLGHNLDAADFALGAQVRQDGQQVARAGADVEH
mmetsp:Transcript_24891/g.80419  ORF Transcript_24891/g.80419 Transcript_24891/m.80419 type:complete len:207 (-) Transcript_24891:360-980(-)